MQVIGSQRYMKDEFPFWITRMTHGSVDEHGHEFVELVFVVRGKGFHIFQGAEFAIRAGDVFIINPGETHAYTVEGDGSLEIINCLFMPSFIPDALLSDLEITGSMDYYYVHPFLGQEARFNHHLNLHGQDAASVLSLLERMIGEISARGIGYAPLIRLQLVELLLLLSRCYAMTRHARSQDASRQLDRVLTARRIYGYLERNYDKKITLQSLSALFNVSTRHLNRLVGEEYGKSVFDLLHVIRIEHAKRLLLESDEKVIAVATMVGYDDPSFFSRLFARHAGCSPREYRAGS
ncbi:AraC family transcriptional regulator [Paenibacillus arenilitoris]|uniref:Helix-turn-helix transcriptional regulator n=1 Tax=Paenibacillus arenilitoris TaxID=2772299 RepID=A0A927CHS2_9BACL|nr:AraC family transcriptional regulator [Paenibacillus arenilitoris]MBD2867282.1 helix-turn-helix transcriptional regulator [Paenibacillus arenilitoris]